jgi:ADP-heptose:LPS heptosyltransferase
VNQWDLLEALPGWRGAAPDRERDAVEMPLDAAADARMAARLARAGIADGDDLIVVHVSAGNRFRRWPEASFVTLVTDLARRHDNRRVAVSSGPSDREAATRIAATAREQLGGMGSRVVDLGEFDLQELRALIGRSRLFIGGDTGPLHIAAATTTAIVGIYGPTLSAQSAPWRGNHAPTEAVEYTDLPCRPCDQRSCAPGDFRCLTRLAPGTVLDAAERAMAAEPRHHS